MSAEVDEAPRRRLSPMRLVFTVGLLAGASLLGMVAVERALARPDRPSLPPWFAPYVDTTLPPVFQFQDRAASPARSVVLGFVVADPHAPCRPSWGGAYSLTAAARALDLDRRVIRLRQQHGDAIASFGGQRNTDLAVACTDGTALAAAYRSVIDRYELTTIDLDVEGSGLTDRAANARRAAAVQKVQEEIRAAHGKLAVWLTLPVARAGLPPESVAMIDAMLHAHVDLAGVNAMTMNLRAADTPAVGRLTAIEDSLVAAQRQLAAAYARAHIHLSTEHVWGKLGATPMLGQNDTVSDHFTPADARGLVDFATRHHMARISMWSLNRDQPCGPNVVALEVVSNYCSGLDQSPLQFSRIFAHLPGLAAKGAGAVTVADRIAVDDPATSPYPIWRSDHGYRQRYKVVWHGNVYQAKWWNRQQVPDAPVVNEWETPWRLVGPVLPGEHAPKVAAVPPATYPAWSATHAYAKGDLVVAAGRAYRAKWWTRGDVPRPDAPNPWDTPWEPVVATPGEPHAG